MTAFDVLWAEAIEDIEAAFGEQVRIEPRLTAPKAAPVPDPGRSVGTTTARFRSKPGTADLEGSREGTRLQGMTRLSSRTASIKLSAASVAALGYVPKSGDQVVLIERPDSPAYTATAPALHGNGELEIGLIPV